LFRDTGIRDLKHTAGENLPVYCSESRSVSLTIINNKIKMIKVINLFNRNPGPEFRDLNVQE